MPQARKWLLDLRGGLTHQEVADMAGIDRSYYTQIENGFRQPSVKIAKKLGNVLGFDWTRFYDDQAATLDHTGTEGRE